MSVFDAIILSIIEGLTEYLPVSSTGHMIVASALLGIQEAPLTKHFLIIVQFGAILAVVFEYYRLLISKWSMYPKLIIGFLPAALLGLLVKSHIDLLLGHVLIVGIALVLGGIALLFLDQLFMRLESKVTTLESIPNRSSFTIGIYQCLAFIPGVSRSAASIFGGVFTGLDKKTATEFSFLLALPTLAGASLLKLYKAWPELSSADLNLFLIGNVISFVVGWMSIRFFIHIVVKFGFKFFGVYRIVFGGLVILFWWLGWVQNV